MKINHVFDRIRLYTQLVNIGDDPEDGSIIAIATFLGDNIVQCWIEPPSDDSDIDEVAVDTLGVSKICRKNITLHDVTHESPVVLKQMLGFLHDGANYLETNPMTFDFVDNTEN